MGYIQINKDKDRDEFVEDIILLKLYDETTNDIVRLMQDLLILKYHNLNITERVIVEQNVLSVQKNITSRFKDKSTLMEIFQLTERLNSIYQSISDDRGRTIADECPWTFDQLINDIYAQLISELPNERRFKS